MRFVPQLSVILALSAVFGCSADAVEEELPTLEMPGAFIAAARAEGGYRLFRTRTALAFDDQRTFLFFDEHLPGARDLSDARRKAQDIDLILVPVAPFLKSQFTKAPWQVVWYRSLTAEERADNGGL